MGHAFIDAAREFEPEIADLVEALVVIPTENPPGRAAAECLRALADACARLGLECEVVEAPRRPDRPARASLLAQYGRGKPLLYFHGHYDVVPAFNEEQFRPRRDGTKLFGRGSADMKGGLAAMLCAVRVLQTSGVALDGSIGLVFVPDEETGGEQGSAYLARCGVLGRDGIGMLSAEPTGGVVWNANRGAISMRVTVRGVSAHIGLSHLGVNAFEGAHAIVERLLRLKAEVTEKGSILLVGGQCGGGANFNTVPADSWFTVDRRINPGESLEEEKQGLMDVIDSSRRAGTSVEVDVFQEGAAAALDQDHPLARALAASIADVTDQPARFEMCPGLLENRFYAERGVPALAYGPGLLSVSHGPEEFVDLDEVCRCAAVYALTAARLLGRRA